MNTTIATTFTGSTFDLAQCERNFGKVHTEAGETVYLTQDAFLDYDHAASEDIYAAFGVDAAGNRYRVEWEITNSETDDAGDACDWDSPRSVVIVEANDDTTLINWRNLIVTDAEGACGTLGNMVDSSPANLDNADYTSNGIAEWPGFYLSEEGMEPSFEVPANVDWSGFAEAMEQVTGLPVA